MSENSKVIELYNGQKIIRVALYIRVSTEEQAMHGLSLGAQEDALVKFANENGHKIVGIYRDEGNSARKPALKRKVMQELLDDVRAGKIDRVLFIKLDRWFRNVREYHTVQAILDENNVTWQATMEDYNTSTADGRLKVNIMLSVAENESDRTSERIKFVFEAKRRKKEFCFSDRTVPFGYMAGMVDGVKRCVKNPETEPIVNDFWQYILKYGSVRKAGMFCNEKYGMTRNYKTWMQNARNEIYTGTYMGVEDYCPAYISRKDWEYVMQSHMLVKKTQRPDRVYLFTGLLRCPCCGNTLKGSFKTYPSDRTKEYKSYRCNNGRLKTCPYMSTPSERKVEKYLLDHVQEELKKFITESEITSKQKKTDVKVMDVVKLNEKLRRLNVIYIAGNISDDEYASETARIKAEIEKSKQIADESRPVDVDGLKEFLRRDFRDLYQSMDLEDRRRMWREIIREVHFDGLAVKEIIFRT